MDYNIIVRKVEGGGEYWTILGLADELHQTEDTLMYAVGSGSACQFKEEIMDEVHSILYDLYQVRDDIHHGDTFYVAPATYNGVNVPEQIYKCEDVHVIWDGQPRPYECDLGEFGKAYMILKQYPNKRIAVIFRGLKTGKAIMTLSVNTPDYVIKPTRFVAKTYSDNEILIPFVLDTGWFEQTGEYVQTGYNGSPVWRFTDKGRDAIRAHRESRELFYESTGVRP